MPQAARSIALLLLVLSLGACAASPPSVQTTTRPGGIGMMGGSVGRTPGPGYPGYVAGTTTTPRVVRIVAGPGLRFDPSLVRITAGETITFVVSSMGRTTHEFKVGPLVDVVADTPAAPEIADITMMTTRSLTYTFTGQGPFGFACHEPGHFEAGMSGTIEVV